MNPKDKKKSHQSKKDKPSDKVVKSDAKVAKTDPKPDKKRDSRSEKKHDRSASPVSKPSTQKQGHCHSPPVNTSSGLESAHQPLMKKGNNSQPSSSPDRIATGPTSQPSSTAFQPDHETDFYRCLCLSPGYRNCTL